MYTNNVPILSDVLPKDPNDPLSLGSDISPTYEDVDPAPNPVLNPISKIDAYNKIDEYAVYSNINPIILGTLAKIIQHFFPNFSCVIIEIIHPIG